MQVNLDMKKFDPKFWIACLALMGFANFGDLLAWVRGEFFQYQGAATAKLETQIIQETKERKSGDSLIITKVDSVAETQKRVEEGIALLQDYVLEIPQVRNRAQGRSRADSIRRDRERIRERTFRRERREASAADMTRSERQ